MALNKQEHKSHNVTAGNIFGKTMNDARAYADASIRHYVHHENGSPSLVCATGRIELIEQEIEIHPNNSNYVRN